MDGDKSKQTRKLGPVVSRFMQSADDCLWHSQTTLSAGIFENKSKKFENIADNIEAFKTKVGKRFENLAEINPKP